MLNIILCPISISYCKKGIYEYCKYTKDYTDEFYKWKEKELEMNKNCCIVAGDVKSLYNAIEQCSSTIFKAVRTFQSTKCLVRTKNVEIKISKQSLINTTKLSQSC